MPKKRDATNSKTHVVNTFIGALVAEAVASMKAYIHGSIDSTVRTHKRSTGREVVFMIKDCFLI